MRRNDDSKWATNGHMVSKAFPELSSVAELGALIREGCLGAPNQLCRKGSNTGVGQQALPVVTWLVGPAETTEANWERALANGRKGVLVTGTKH